jgi:hypothetical protein
MFSKLIMESGIKRCSSRCSCYLEAIQLSIKLPLRKEEEIVFAEDLQKHVENQKRCKNYVGKRDELPRAMSRKMHR